MRGEEKEPGLPTLESVLIASSLFSVLPEQETGLAKEQSLVESGDYGHENPGAGSVKLGHLKTVVLISQTRVSEVGSPGKCGCMSPNIQSGEDCHPGDCGHLDTRCRVWQGGALLSKPALPPA